MALLDEAPITPPGAGEQDALEAVLAAAEHTLRQRASDLAHVPEVTAQHEYVDMLVFRLGAEHYAVDMRLLRAVQRTTGLTPVPCTPPHIAGILNVRGAIVSVLNLAAALELADSADTVQEGRVLLAELPRGRIGFLVDEVLGHRPFAIEELQPSLSRRSFVRGIAETRITVLDLEEFFAGERFEVREDGA